jgi:hypothetical protein
MRVSPRWRKPNWGSSKLGLTGDRLRTILGGWVRDDPTELTAGQFILSESGGREFERRRAAAGGTRSY